ncbi:gluconate 2-dehydrogenase subunit 3 family protein [Methylocella sp.]|uniref:gluconate 2-dehydrogenase subunit 3 family protein n=1 Tax=Methylocella sp. TaxID=1978226 RepID=UPI0037843EC4
MTDRLTTGRYPGYDVTSKRNTPSWNDKTREVIDARLDVASRPAFLSAEEWLTLVALCDRVMPQPEGRPRAPLAAYVDRQLLAGKTKGYRFADMPQPAEAWKRALAALDEVATREKGRPFAHLTQGDQDAMLHRMATGSFVAEALKGMPAATFWTSHVIHDVIGSYYAHPEAWNEMGWGGPASPRGYVRLDLDARDSWEPVEAAAGGEDKARRENSRVR